MRSGVWERLEREYQEKRRIEDERRREQRRRELDESRDWRVAMERNPYEGWSAEEILLEAGKRWGVDFFEGIEPRPRTAALRESGVKVEVVEVPGRGRPGYKDSVAMAALRIIFH